MASVNTTISDFRFDVNADTSQLTDNQALWILNRAYRDIINDIKAINEDYFYNYWKTDTVIGQEEYTFPAKTVNNPGMTKLKWVSIKFLDTDTDYTKLRLDNANNLPKDLLYYKDNQPKSDGFYTISDNSYFIFPAPEYVITEGILLYGISDPIDLVIDGAEATIKIPLEYHHILPLAMKKYYYASRNMINEKNDALAELNIEKTRMLKNLSMRNIAPVQVQEPILYNLY